MYGIIHVLSLNIPHPKHVCSHADAACQQASLHIHMISKSFNSACDTSFLHAHRYLFVCFVTIYPNARDSNLFQ